jgi:hypothetical protein
MKLTIIDVIIIFVYLFSTVIIGLGPEKSSPEK